MFFGSPILPSMILDLFGPGSAASYLLSNWSASNSLQECGGTPPFLAVEQE
jgi:hypothetical protein